MCICVYMYIYIYVYNGRGVVPYSLIKYISIFQVKWSKRLFQRKALLFQLFLGKIKRLGSSISLQTGPGAMVPGQGAGVGGTSATLDWENQRGKYCYQPFFILSRLSGKR